MERRLAAILAADLVGYSRLMGADEEGTLARLQVLQSTVLDPGKADHRYGPVGHGTILLSPVPGTRSGHAR